MFEMDKAKESKDVQECVAINSSDLSSVNYEDEEFEGDTIVLNSSLRIPSRKKDAEDNGRSRRKKKKAFDVKLFWDPAIQEIVSYKQMNIVQNSSDSS